MQKLVLSLILMYPIFSHTEELHLNVAAVKALKESFNAPNGDQWEYGGIIVFRNGTFYWTNPPITTKQIDSNEINPKSLLLKGDILAAKYHTHPCLPNTHFPGYFSLTDLAYSQYFEVPEFILDECTGNVQEFNPLRDDPESIAVNVEYTDLITGERETRAMVKGTMIGNIGQKGPVLE
jgi:hypothetical protein